MTTTPNPPLWGDQLPTLCGQRVTLRWPRETDAEDLMAIFGDPEVTRFWSHGPLADSDAAVALVREIHRFFAERVLFQWAVTEGDSDRVIGTCTLHRWSAQHRRAEVGFALRRSWWGRGCMQDAVTTMIEFAFGPMNLHRLEADVDPRNQRSLRLLEKLGFHREGLLAERFHVGDEIQDSVLLGLLERHWRARRAPETSPSLPTMDGLRAG